MVALRTFYCFNKKMCDISVTPVLTTKRKVYQQALYRYKDNQGTVHLKKKKGNFASWSKSFSCVAYKLITLKENSLQYSSLSQRPLGDLKAKLGAYEFFFFYLVFLSRFLMTRIIQRFRQKLLTERTR